MRTPGARNGIQKRAPRSRTQGEGASRRPTRVAFATTPRQMRIVAETVANRNEFQSWWRPAASAPGNSVQVRFAEAIWINGSPSERRQTAQVKQAENATQPFPSWRRNNAAAAELWKRGQWISRRDIQRSKPAATIISGKLSLRVP